MTLRRWITILTVFTCTISPCMAQTVNHHQKPAAKHKRIAHTSIKHKSSHKLKHYTVAHNKSNGNAMGPTENSYKNNSPQAKAKLVSSTVPQPQFDSTNFAATNNNVISTAALDDLKPLATNIPPIAATATDTPATPTTTNAIAATTDTTIDASQIDTSQEALTALAYKTVETQRYSRYKLGGNVFDQAQGIYKIDCSAYINDLLSEANPQAFSNLTNLTQTYKPTSHDYYMFITRLPDEPARYWRKINSVGQLQPGGILVFLSQYLHRHHLYAGGGHVMLVMSKPIPHPSLPDTYQIKVADSAPSGHSDDTRLPHKSGIGIGTLLLKVDPFTGQPKAYAWKLDDHWRFHTLFAMAQPLNNTY